MPKLTYGTMPKADQHTVSRITADCNNAAKHNRLSWPEVRDAHDVDDDWLAPVCEHLRASACFDLADKLEQSAKQTVTA